MPDCVEAVASSVGLAVEGAKMAMDGAGHAVEGAKKSMGDAERGLSEIQAKANSWVTERLHRGEEALCEGPRVAILLREDAPPDVLDALYKICKGGNVNETMVAYRALASNCA